MAIEALDHDKASEPLSIQFCCKACTRNALTVKSAYINGSSEDVHYTRGLCLRYT